MGTSLVRDGSRTSLVGQGRGGLKWWPERAKCLQFSSLVGISFDRFQSKPLRHGEWEAPAAWPVRGPRDPAVSLAVSPWQNDVA